MDYWYRKVLTPLARYSLHVWLILFMANFGVYYALRFHLLAAECMTRDQVASDDRCLYIYQNDVYEIGTKSSPHMGHPCGSEPPVPSFHIANVAKYLDPRRVTNICTAAPDPTPTPQPQPSPTPIPPSPTTPPAQPTNPPAPTQPQVQPTHPPAATQPPAQPTRPPAAQPTATPKPQTVKPTAKPTQKTAAPLGVKPTEGPPPAQPTGFLEEALTQIEDQPESNIPTEESVEVTAASNGWSLPLGLSMGWWIRTLALVGFGALVGTMALGFFRVKLFQHLPRGVVMWAHYIGGGLAAIGIVGHIVLTVLDKEGWGLVVKPFNIFVPEFASATDISISLGVASVYLMALVLVSGLFFRRIVKRTGYRTWNLLHLASLILVMVVFIHGLRLGTDMTKALVKVMMWGGFLYTLYETNRTVWKLFHLPRPSLSFLPKASKKETHPEDSEVVEGSYFVMPEVSARAGQGSWVQLSNGFTRIWAWTNRPPVQPVWLGIRGRRQVVNRIPYVLIEEMRPVR